MSKRTAALVEALQSRMARRIEALSDHDEDGEVYVSLKSSPMPLSDMDDACVIAHDHGFVPRGITEDGAVRFKPRDSVEIRW